MPLIQNPTPGRKLQRGLRLTDLPDSVLAPEIVGVILLEDYSAPLSDISRGCIGRSAGGPTALENIGISLVRAGSPPQYDLVVTRAWFSTTTTQEIRLVVPSTPLVGKTLSPDTSFTDLELPGRPSSELGVISQVGIPAGRNIMTMHVLANTLIQIAVDIRIGTIGQGDDLTTLLIIAGDVNTRLVGGFDWVESEPQG